MDGLRPRYGVAARPSFRRRPGLPYGIAILLHPGTGNGQRAGGRTGAAMKLRLGIPKGSLQEATLSLFTRAGLRVYSNARSYFAATEEPEMDCLLIRAQERASYGEHVRMHAGLTGVDA